MGIVSLLLLVLLGVLGIASWLQAKLPAANSSLRKLEPVEGWIGLVGLIWGVVMLLQALPLLRFLGNAPVTVLISLISVFVVIALSLILAIPVVRSLLGSNAFATKLAHGARKLHPFKVVLGFTCLVLAALSLLSVLGIRFV